MSKSRLRERAPRATGVGDPDERLADVIDLLSRMPLDGLNSFLDIGFGEGQLTHWLCLMGKSVTATGLRMDSYGCDTDSLCRDHGVRIEECYAESMPFGDGEFDAVVMSHVLEHCPNVRMALREVRRVLSDDGRLLIFVPPHSHRVCAGHVSVGWNIGQLMYVLLLNGFDVRSGGFVETGHNVAAFVGKNHVPLPELRGDRGDIRVLSDAGLFPVPVVTADGANDSFHGRIRSLNWQRGTDRASLRGLRSTAKSFVRGLAGRIPSSGRRRICAVLSRIESLLSDGRIPVGDADYRSNPNALS